MATEGYDFVEDRTREGRKSRTLNVVEPRGSPKVDEFARECLAIRVGHRLGSTEVIDVLTDMFISFGQPKPPSLTEWLLSGFGVIDLSSRLMRHLV